MEWDFLIGIERCLLETNQGISVERNGAQGNGMKWSVRERSGMGFSNTHNSLCLFETNKVFIDE